jgi:hypothetical protein
MADDNAKIDQAAADARAQEAQMLTDYRNSPAFKAAELRRELEALDQNPDFLGRELAGTNGAQQHRQALRTQLAAAEAAAETEVKQAFSEQKRVELALAGQVDHHGIETTVDGQVPNRDFAKAIGDDVELGIRADIIKSFYADGRSNDPVGHVGAKIWLDAYMRDPELQRLHAAGDRTVTRHFKLAHMYLAGQHENVSPEKIQAEVEALERAGW